MKFYAGNIAFLISEERCSLKEEAGKYILTSADAAQVLSYYRMVRGSKVVGQADFLFYVNNYNRTVQEVFSYFNLVEAAGGLVEKKNRLLFIYRFKKWDFPKGKAEKGESPEETALREVEEECNVKVSMLGSVGKTWHTYTMGDKEYMKCTHWFRMLCTDDSQMTAQTEEGIEEVRWMNTEEIDQEVLPTTYASIRSIYEDYLLQHE